MAADDGNGNCRPSPPGVPSAVFDLDGVTPDTESCARAPHAGTPAARRRLDVPSRISPEFYRTVIAAPVPVTELMERFFPPSRLNRRGTGANIGRPNAIFDRSVPGPLLPRIPWALPGNLQRQLQ